MCDKKWVKNDPQQGECVMSIAAQEAFEFLNAGQKQHYRGCGDTPTAARDRAAREAGITPAQAERVWKRWKTMGSVDGDVYRSLRNTFGPLVGRYNAFVEKHNGAADAYRAEWMKLRVENVNEDHQGPS